MDRRWLLLAPSAFLLLITLPLWLLWPPPSAEPRAHWAALVLLGLAVAALLLALGWGLERGSPSFRHASRRLEGLVRRLRLPPAAGAGVALATGVAEELFFRGWLLHVAGLWWQAALFMLLHPAGRRGWAYTLFTGLVGALFGAITLWSGSILSAIVAHVVVNLHGLLTATAQRLAGRRAAASPPASLPAERDGGEARPS